MTTGLSAITLEDTSCTDNHLAQCRRFGRQKKSESVNASAVFYLAFLEFGVVFLMFVFCMFAFLLS